MISIPLVFAGVGYLVAFLRKGSVRGAHLGSRRLEVHTPADPAAAYERIRALRGKFQADDFDPNAKIVVLASSVSFGSWGFFYPVFIHAAGSGARIEIGIHSKFVQFGPIVSKWHRQCAAAIEEALSIPMARVA